MEMGLTRFYWKSDEVDDWLTGSYLNEYPK
jgi:hypothetical protein